MQQSSFPAVSYTHLAVYKRQVLILSCETYQEEADSHLAEKRISRKHPWIGKTLKEIRFPDNSMVILIRRGNQSILPKGDTKILYDDVLVFYDVSRQLEPQKTT